MATGSSILTWKNSMDRGAWQATVHGITKSQIRLSAQSKESKFQNSAYKIHLYRCVCFKHIYIKSYFYLHSKVRKSRNQNFGSVFSWWRELRVLVWLSNFYSVEFQTYKKVANRIQWMLFLHHLIHQLLPSCRICSARVCAYTHIYTCALLSPLKVS